MFKVMAGVSAMFKVIAGGVRGVSNVEGDRRGEGRQPCSR